MGYFLPQELPQTVSQPAVHLHKLLRLTEFAHLRDGEARIEFLMRNHPQVRGGRTVLGSVHLPGVQGQLKDVFIWMLEEKFGELPDFLVILDADYWQESGEREREILIFHELCHAIHAKDKNGDDRFDAEGRPVWGLAGHDIEEFNAVVRRYGQWSQDVRDFIAAAGEHDGR